MLIKATGSLGSNRTIKPLHKSFSFTKPINEKNPKCSFRTEDRVEEWDEVIVWEDDLMTTKLFAGIAERVPISKANGETIYSVTVSGYRRTFDRLKVNKTYNTASQKVGDIVKDIVDNFTEGFTRVNVQDGPEIPLVRFNFEKPSLAISELARSVGYSWKIDLDKDVHLFPKTTNTGPFTINAANSNLYRDFQLTPNVENFANVVIVRAGTERSAEVSIEFLGDGTRTIFNLPERPHDVSVEVDTGSGYSSKTLGTKLGEETPTTEFVLNYQEKYVENGTHAVLSATDKIKVLYKFDYPIRLEKRNVTSIDAMKALYSGTNGRFETVVDAPNINSRDLAKELADEHLDNFSNTEISGSFKTFESGFDEGDILTIDTTEFSGDAVVQKIKSKSLANGWLEHTVKFATVLFDFEDFLRELAAAKKESINENEVVEILTDFEDDLTLSDSLTASKDQNRIEEDFTLSHELHTEKNKALVYVWGPYTPSGFSDTKRVGIFDGSTWG